MKRLLAGIMTIIMATTLLAGCGSGSNNSVNSHGDGETYNWKMALVSTEGDNGYDAGAVFADKINQLTDGRVNVELFGGASLGTTSEVLEGMSAGVADIMVESTGTLAPFTEMANIDAMPYVYSGYDHFMSVWNSELGDQMRNDIGEAAGFKLLGASYRGPRIVTATKKMETIEDFKGFKLRTPNLDCYIQTWKWMNAAPTPMSMSEVYTALQQGTVEGQENPFSTSLSFAFDEVCNYWIKTNHVYSCNVFIMDDDYFASLPEDIQAAVKEAAEYAGQTISQKQQEKDAELEGGLKEKGCEIIDVDVSSFIEYFNGFAEENYPDLADWVSQIQAMDSNA